MIDFSILCIIFIYFLNVRMFLHESIIYLKSSERYFMYNVNLLHKILHMLRSILNINDYFMRDAISNLIILFFVIMLD